MKKAVKYTDENRHSDRPSPEITLDRQFSTQGASLLRLLHLHLPALEWVGSLNDRRSQDTITLALDWLGTLL